MTNGGLIGGTYSDEGVSKPFLAGKRDQDNFYRVTRLTTDSGSSEAFLNAQSTSSTYPLDNEVQAITTDGGQLRSYTWLSLSRGSDDIIPTHTGRETFGGITGTLTSAFATESNAVNAPGSSPKLVFAAYSQAGASKIVVSLFQGNVVLPSFNSSVSISKNTSAKQLQPSQHAGNLPQGIALSNPPAISWFKCTSQSFGSDRTVSQTSVPAGCAPFGTAEGAVFAGDDDEFLDYGQMSEDDGVGHFLISFSYSNPNFVYYSPTAQLTSSDYGSGGSTITPPSTGLASPTVASVVPVRGGAQVYFSRGSNEPGTSYTVTATDGNTEITGSGTTSPITVGGLQDGTSYTFRITATGPDGTPASPGTASSPAAPLAPGGADAFFFGSIEHGPIPSIGIDENADARPQPSGNIYFISADVRRILPSGQEDTDNFGTGGVVVPDSITGIVKDVVEVIPQGATEPELYFLVDDSGTLKVVKTDSKGENPVTETPSLTPPSNPLEPRLVVTGGVVTAEIPGVDLPSTPLPTNFALAAGSPAPAGSPLAGGTAVVGIADGDLVIAVTSTDNSVSPPTTTVPSTFNGGNPVVIDNTSGTTEVAGVAIDDEGNIYVSARINGATVVLAYTPTGEVLTDFATGGTFTFSTQTIPGSIRITDGRVVVSASTTSGTTLQALVTPGGLSAMPLAISSTLAPAAGPVAAPFAGPILSGVASGGIQATAGGNVSIQGQQLGSVSAAKIGGLDAEVVSASDTGLELKLPAGLAAGTYDLVLTSAQGVVTIQGAIRVTGDLVTETARGNGQWTKAERNSAGVVESVRMYAKDPVNAGKIQFMVNGREIAWVRATDETDPKLRTRSNGESYLVRTVTLQPGKNALEIYIDGERVWRAAYTLR
jgi:hypothetical protein